jgi:uncharacterized protein
MNADARAMLERLEARFRPLQSVVVAFSGGVDSSLAALVALRTLGRDRVLAVTARSPSLPRAELSAAAAVAAEIGVSHEFIDTAEFENARYLQNPANRCYFCKTELYSRLAPLAAARGFHAIVNGVNADDLSDYRPGLQAAGEHGVHAPLADAGLTKADVRTLAAALGLSIHDKPAGPCLSSRVQYGEAITPEKLARIDAAEDFLRSAGFPECRVRHHGDLARIEVPPADIERLAAEPLRSQIDAEFRRLGYRYVALDLRGFRSGSMNEVLIGEGLRRGAGNVAK